MMFTVAATENEALGICATIDSALGYPRIDLDQLGREVLTERYALPIALADGTWIIPMDPETAALCELDTVDLDPTTITRAPVED